MMFPYPSAEGLHVGNMFAFTGSDIYGRFKRLQGYDVFEPIGFDAFGIHSENYAIKLGINPGVLIPQNITNFRRQLRRIGGMFDWRHELSTTDPAVLQVDPVDLPAAVQGGEGLQEGGRGQLVPQGQDRAGQRAGHQRPLRAVRHAGRAAARSSSGSSGSPTTRERLLADLDDKSKMDWSDTTTTAQRNWIGRSEGAELEFPIGGEAQGDGDAGRRRHPRLHHPARHRLRRHLHGAGARAPAGRAPDLGRAARRRSRRTARPPRRRTWSPARSASARRPASSPAATRPIPPPASRSRSGSPTTS